MSTTTQVLMVIAAVVAAVSTMALIAYFIFRKPEKPIPAAGGALPGGRTSVVPDPVDTTKLPPSITAAFQPKEGETVEEASIRVTAAKDAERTWRQSREAINKQLAAARIAEQQGAQWQAQGYKQQ